MKLISTILQALLFSSALSKNFQDEVADAVDFDDVDDAPKSESGMIYSIPQSIEHKRNYFEGFLVGFYHNPNAMVGEQCLQGKIE